MISRSSINIISRRNTKFPFVSSKWLKRSFVQTEGELNRFIPVIFPASALIFFSFSVCQALICDKYADQIFHDLSEFSFRILSSHMCVAFWVIGFISWFLLFSFRKLFLVCCTTICFVSGASHLQNSLKFSLISAVSNSGRRRFTLHSSWADWMVTAPLLILMIGDMIRLRPKYVLNLMMSQFIVTALGYASEIIVTQWGKVLCFLVSVSLCVVTILFLYLFCTHFISQNLTVLSKQKNKAFTAMKFVSLWLFPLWSLFPVTYSLNLAGVLSEAFYLLVNPLLDFLFKFFFIGLCFLIWSCLDFLKQLLINEEMEKKNMMEENFLRYVYHEIRNPFNTLTLGLDFLQTEVQSQESCLVLASLKKSAAVMTKIIDDALNVSESKIHLQLIKQPTDLKALVQACIRDFRGKAKKKNITFIQNVSDVVPEHVMIDQAKVMKIFRCFISNAVKFSRNSSKVEVTLKLENFTSIETNKCTVTFSVRDCGFGIPEEMVPTLLEPFANARPGDFLEDEDRGSGLSLCMAKILCDLMGAKIRFQTAEGVGSTFHVTLDCEECFEDVDALENAGLWDSIVKKLDNIPCVSRDSASQHSDELQESTNSFWPSNPIQRAYHRSPRTSASQRRASEGSTGQIKMLKHLPFHSTLGSLTSNILGNNSDTPKKRVSFNVPQVLVSSAPSSKYSSRENSLQQFQYLNKLRVRAFSSFTSCDDADEASEVEIKGTHTSSLSNEQSQFHLVEVCSQRTDESSWKFNFTNQEQKVELQSEFNFTNQEQKVELQSAEFPAEALQVACRARHPPPNIRTTDANADYSSLYCLSAQDCDASIAENVVHGGDIHFSSTSNCVIKSPTNSLKQTENSLMNLFTPPSKQMARRSRSSVFCSSPDAENNESMHREENAQNGQASLSATTNSEHGSEAGLKRTIPLVLVVDDVKSNVKLTSMILKKAGYECDTASNGIEAVEMASKNNYSLIFMDNVMPLMNGVEATRHILRFDESVPIIGMTGNVVQRDQDEFIHAGIKMLIKKPANKVQLLQACENFCRVGKQ